MRLVDDYMMAKEIFNLMPYKVKNNDNDEWLKLVSIQKSGTSLTMQKYTITGEDAWGSDVFIDVDEGEYFDVQIKRANSKEPRHSDPINILDGIPGAKAVDLRPGELSEEVKDFLKKRIEDIGKMKNYLNEWDRDIKAFQEPYIDPFFPEGPETEGSM